MDLLTTILTISFMLFLLMTIAGIPMYVMFVLKNDFTETIETFLHYYITVYFVDGSLMVLIFLLIFFLEL